MKTKTENMLKKEKTRGKTGKTIKKQKLEYEENRRTNRENILKTEQTRGKTRKTSEKQSATGCEPRGKRLKTSRTQLRKQSENREENE